VVVKVAFLSGEHRSLSQRGGRGTKLYHRECLLLSGKEAYVGGKGPKTPRVKGSTEDLSGVLPAQ